MAYLGEFSAILTALCWALSIFYFRQLCNNFSPLSLNLWKGVIAIFGLIMSIAFSHTSFFSSQHDVLWLLLSGAIGIGIGDSAFFAALNRMCERTTLLLTETLAPIFTAALAIVWLAEWLSAYQWLAIAIILLGVDLVIRSRKGKKRSMDISWSGFNFAALAALCQAVGAVIGRDVLIHSDIDIKTASLYRLLGGVLLVMVLLISTRKKWLPQEYKQVHLWKTLFKATLIGTLIAMVLQTFSFQHAPAAIVQVLFASSILFSLLLAKLRGQVIARTALYGSAIAMFGVSLIFLK
ncbi:MAG: EamA family transporter [Gammaproteobacteria bacterium CG22_combo_CG10-13_8_21_14_all_40_8]|nr:MAG: EamA family transporter [Gammaproteobacteria bacterium CG22_combo_CG10-13_8_21_14_all_40_8]